MTRTSPSFCPTSVSCNRNSFSSWLLIITSIFYSSCIYMDSPQQVRPVMLMLLFLRSQAIVVISCLVIELVPSVVKSSKAEFSWFNECLLPEALLSFLLTYFSAKTSLIATLQMGFQTTILFSKFGSTSLIWQMHLDRTLSVCLWTR